MALAEKLTLTGLLARQYWNKRLVRKLLGDPDEIVLRPDGSAARKYYFINRVVIAEATTQFLCYKKEKDEESQEHEVRLIELRESMKYAIESDLNNISVPLKGELKEIVTSMSAQMQMYNTMLKLTDEILVWDALNIVDPQLKPIFQICKKVGLHRQDLAFEAGRLYERSKFESHDHLLLGCFT